MANSNNEKTYLPNVKIRDVVEADREKFNGLNFDFILDFGHKLIEYGDLYCTISKYDYEAYGKERLCEVVYSEYSNVCEEYFLKVDFAKIANDITFNKPLEVAVQFVENVPGTNESIFKSENGKHYIRQDCERESCAKWFSAFKREGRWVDHASIRANVTFIMGDEREKVTFSNWNGEGVYSEEYNKAFSYDAVQIGKKPRVADLIANAEAIKAGKNTALDENIVCKEER